MRIHSWPKTFPRSYVWELNNATYTSTSDDLHPLPNERLLLSDYVEEDQLCILDLSRILHLIYDRLQPTNTFTATGQPGTTLVAQCRHCCTRVNNGYGDESTLPLTTQHYSLVTNYRLSTATTQHQNFTISNTLFPPALYAAMENPENVNHTRPSGSVTTSTKRDLTQQPPTINWLNSLDLIFLALSVPFAVPKNLQTSLFVCCARPRTATALLRASPTSTYCHSAICICSSRRETCLHHTMYTRVLPHWKYLKFIKNSDAYFPFKDIFRARSCQPKHEQMIDSPYSGNPCVTQGSSVYIRFYKVPNIIYATLLVSKSFTNNKRLQINRLHSFGSNTKHNVASKFREVHLQYFT